MNRNLKTTVMALALAGAAAIGTANAASVVFDPGVVAYGYNDGYWTRKHEWRAWAQPEHRQAYRGSPERRILRVGP